MKKEPFFACLRKHLSHLPQEEIDEIIRDQEEYIREAVNAGRAEDAVIDSLGDPAAFAANLSVGAKIQHAEQANTFKKQISSTINAVFAILALAPLNFIFVLGPFLLLLAILAGAWGVAMLILFMPALALFIFLSQLTLIPMGFMMGFSVLFFIFGCIGLGLLTAIFVYKITRIFLSGTLGYLKWNLNFIISRT